MHLQFLSSVLYLQLLSSVFMTFVLLGLAIHMYNNQHKDISLVFLLGSILSCLLSAHFLTDFNITFFNFADAGILYAILTVSGIILIVLITLSLRRIY